MAWRGRQEKGISGEGGLKGVSLGENEEGKKTTQNKTKEREDMRKKVEKNKVRGWKSVSMLHRGTLSTINKEPCLKSSAAHNVGKVSGEASLDLIAGRVT